MSYRVRIAPAAQRQIRAFAEYLANYSDELAAEQRDRLSRILSIQLAESPSIWSYFALTGAPYRAYLYRVGRRTHYWIIYTVDDEARVVEVVSFWNSARDPRSIEL